MTAWVDTYIGSQSSQTIHQYATHDEPQQGLSSCMHGSFVFCTRLLVHSHYGRVLNLSCFVHSFVSRRSNEYHVVEGPGYGKEVQKRLYSSAEVLIPGTFSSNGRRQVKDGKIVMQFLQHCTHALEKESIWNGKVATFKGNPKLARLHIRKRFCCAMSWKVARDGKSLEQIMINNCSQCTEKKHECRGNCCCAICDAEGDYTKLALKTCKTRGVCNGKDCLMVGTVLPSSYVWFSIAQAKEDISDTLKGLKLKDSKLSTPEGLTATGFLKSWNGETPYGVHAFIVDIKNLLDIYGQQIAPKDSPVVLRCGGTLLYTKEVCYVPIVTYRGDGIHDSFPLINSPDIDNEDNPRFNWSPLLDDKGHCSTKGGYPTFSPCHKQGVHPFYWDHVAFAIHLPEGKQLSLPKDILVGEKPQDTVHYGPGIQCHRFCKFGKNAAEECRKAERAYEAGTLEHNKASSKKVRSTQ